jgi:selenocysteine lyase/cysteine desulfurase
MEEVGIDTIQKKEEENRQKLIDLLSEYSFVHIVGNDSDNEHVGVVSVLLEGLSSDSCGSIFDRLGIAVRTGLQCAPLAHRFLGTYPAGTVRFSVGYFTTESDFEELKHALTQIAEDI